MPSLAPIQPRSNPAGQAGSAEPPRPQAVFPKCDPRESIAKPNFMQLSEFSGYFADVHVDSGDRQMDTAGKVRDRGMLGYA
jgi:hypothetical protein